MFANYIATALSNLARNWLHAAISIFGLAVSFAGAILVAQFVRTEFSYDRWISGYQDIYKLTATLEQPGQSPVPGDLIMGSTKQELKDQFPGVIASARLLQAFPTILQTPDTGDGGAVDQTFAWVDPEFFQVFPLPAIAGDPTTALDQPDSVVLTERTARKYFGRADVMGETLTIIQGTNTRPHKVTAVLKDLPARTTLVTEVYATGKSSYSPIGRLDAGPPQRTAYAGQTFVRVKPDVTPFQLQAALEETVKPNARALAPFGMKLTFGHVALVDAHLTEPGLTHTVIKPAGSRQTAMQIATVGALIVLVAGINFVTLMTARASRRALEVGVRKVNGATRGDLIMQFMGEALIYATLSMILAVGIAGLLAEPFSTFVQRGLEFDFVRDPTLTLGLVGATLVIGVLGGIYPALVLSSFKPGTVLKGGQANAAGSAVTRHALVVVQFAILIGLVISTITIYQQTRYALAQGLGSDSDMMIQVRTNCANAAFLTEVRKLPGVERAACSSMNALSMASARGMTPIVTAGGMIPFDVAPVHFEFFETYDIKPIAGRVFERSRGADNPARPQLTPPVPGQAPGPPAGFVPRPVIINATGAKLLGYETPEDAVGKTINWAEPGMGLAASEIVGVTPDLPVSVSAMAAPTIYFVLDQGLTTLSIRAKADADLPTTVNDIQRTWKATNNVRPIEMTFYSDYRRTQYLDIIIQATLIGICAGAAIVIACLGLFALSAFAAERRTKEIGVRKALGATTSSVLSLLMWQFTLPVLIAIVVALPVGYFLMTQWLQNYTYRIDISPWTLVAAALAALAVAWLTIFVQTYMVARAKPVKALRYE
jgi:putative ABC transport system permease protein